MEIQNLMVTGGCGFIGSNFIRYLLEKDDFSGRIINVDKLTYAGNPGIWRGWRINSGSGTALKKRISATPTG